MIRPPPPFLETSTTMPLPLPAGVIQDILPHLPSDGGTLVPDSFAWLQPASADEAIASRHRQNAQQHPELRWLGNDQNDDLASLLVDEDGNQYESYAMAWRYLGLYMDCDLDDQGQEEQEDNPRGSAGKEPNDRRHRNLPSEDGNDCSRKVLWAAYVDPGYSGNSIGEYRYYNLTTGRYDDSYCRGERCVRMDCHEPDTQWKLAGVLKENDGFYDWAEQLFKHQGYCLWTNNVYDVMSTLRQYLPYYCKRLYFPDDNDGTPLYVDVRPMPKGDIDIAVFEDEQCTQVSKTTTLEDYITEFYETNHGSRNKGLRIARMWQKAVKRWNHHMQVYKICQPCRAYSLHQFDWMNEQDEDHSGSHDRQLLSEDPTRQARFLGDKDGNGDDEQWGYDCYDDAGYTNCNQCYKFGTQTDMELVDVIDLERATKQESMLRIEVDGVIYGRGAIREIWWWRIPSWAHILIIVLSAVLFALVVVIGGIVGVRKLLSTSMTNTIWYWIRDRWRRRTKDLPSSFKEHYHIEADPEIMTDHHDNNTATLDTDDGSILGCPQTHVSYVYE